MIRIACTARLIATLAMATVVHGCSAFDAPGVKLCEESLLGNLKTPSTYKRIKAQSHLINDSTARYQSVDIEYDAQNAYGALMRETKSCYYPVDGTDLRDDLVLDTSEALGNAVNGRDYFSPKAKLPTRAERSRELSAEVDEFRKQYEAQKNLTVEQEAAIGATDYMEAAPAQ